LIIGAGSLFLSHVNDAGFWLVKESFGLTVGQTLRSWSLMETAVSVAAFGFIMALSVIV
jgi:GntP family gluconate:H+ symporter